jgi:hypothetical protein
MSDFDLRSRLYALVLLATIADQTNARYTHCAQASVL